MLGTREGALRGLVSVGKEAVRRGVVQAGGGKIVGEDTERAKEMGIDTTGVEQAMMVPISSRTSPQLGYSFSPFFYPPKKGCPRNATTSRRPFRN